MLLKPVKLVPIIHHKCVNGAGVTDQGSKHDRVDVNPGHWQTIKLSSRATDSEEKFRLASLNVDNMTGHAEKVVEILTRRKVHVCCLQEIRWRDASARLIMVMDSEYKISWVGNNFGLGSILNTGC